LSRPMYPRTAERDSSPLLRKENPLLRGDKKRMILSDQLNTLRR
jgi:hypothetical protein